MKIYIADDMDSDREKLCGVLNEWAEKNGAPCDISVFKSGDELIGKCKTELPGLVFLDIYMNGINGIDTAAALRKISIGCLIVFITSSREHTWEAFPLHAFDYVVKPWKSETIFNIMNEAAACLNEDMTVEFTVGRQKLHIRASEIGCVTADNHHVIITANSGERIKSYSSFSAVAKQIERDKRFIFCNRGIIVNMEYIDKCEEKNFLLKNGDIIPIRLRDISELRRIYAEYTFKNAKRWR